MQSYKKYQRLLYSMAHKFSKRSGRDMQELMGYANMYFVHACHKYNSANGVKFSTFLTHVVHNGLLYELGKHKLECGMPEEFDTASRDPSPEQALMFKQGLASLSKEAQMVVNVIFNAPKELSDQFFTGTPTQAKQSLARYFEQKHGWDRKKSTRNFDEIRQLLEQKCV